MPTPLESESDQPEPSTSTPEQPAEPTSAVPTNGDWQAIFSPQHNTYYFYNTVTSQTTWENPLIPPQPQPQPQPESAYDAALAAGIDPSLAYLDPTLAAGPSASSSGPYTATAKFNARTGRFTANDARDPTHMSEYERAKRMSEFYFDVAAWESQRDREQQEEEAEGKKRKRPSKKDLERFKEQKRLKKIAKTAWLRT
ncbi:uncharacterized protein BT62DRAFT_999042 [Guyanagaster necrorhizus]|uniref:WW domain-containing protein n=1 Tax=Guyanagaster necrorhizus TaxID=856835 RepID=A0A9P8AYZ2_9AGAR|nr:uncharacterized protein BT62DRAFT_999042 [Guyanagaster necrorhizus MCA 3950]KAG7453005.1 hypothetical protein BT62DRAFT_999042 [Guyanagaster necrorhizus MCA 3950]